MFSAALSHRVYNRTLPTALIERVFGEDANEGVFAVHNVLRKIYSIVAFTLVGFVIDKALPPSRRRALRSALIVAAFSACIEIGQTLRHVHEGLGMHTFDIGCGALGGWLAIALQRLFRRPKTAL
jgi:hypothetical protein